VEDKARETGTVVVYVSPYRNSEVCPIHFTLLRDSGSWHTLYCPHGHDVDRDHAALLNMLWKTTPEGVVKAVWWNLKDVKRRLEKGRGLVPRDFAKRRNPLITWPVVYTVWTSLMALKASSQWPAVLGRAAPMTPARGADEGWGEGASPRGTRPREEVRYARALGRPLLCESHEKHKNRRGARQDGGVLEALGVERRRVIKPDARKMLYILPMAYGELFGFVSHFFLTRPLSSHPSTEAPYYVVEKYY
jgi:hypothetical protein